MTLQEVEESLKRVRAVVESLDSVPNYPDPRTSLFVVDGKYFENWRSKYMAKLAQVQGCK
jgi:hypothetical protein